MQVTYHTMRHYNVHTRSNTLARTHTCIFLGGDVFYFVEGKGSLDDLSKEKDVNISSVHLVKAALLPKVAPGTYEFRFRDSDNAWSEERDDLPPPTEPTKGRVLVKLIPQGMLSCAVLNFGRLLQ